MSFNFGTPAFGAPAATTSSFSFSNTPAKTTGGFGFNLGTTTQSSAPAFSLGASTTTTNTGFSLGGLPTSSTNTFGSGFGGGFGSAAGQPAQPATGFSGFGTNTGGSLFGAPATTSAAPSFSFPTFGQPATTSAPSLFSNFGQNQQASGFNTFKPQAAPTTGQPAGFGGFGLATPQFGSGGGFGQPQQQLQQQGIQQVAQQQQSLGIGLDPIYNSVFNVCMFGDERDEVLSKWNLLQACWGTGKGFYAPNVPPVEYTPQNPLCRFKAITYNVKPSSESKEGLVAIYFNKKEEEIRSQENQFLTSLNTVLGNKPHLLVSINAVKPVSDTASVVLIYVEEKAPNGMSRRVPNTELCSYLLGVTQKQQLTNMGAVDLFPHSVPDKHMTQQYLDNPPHGIEPGLWKQAQLDNPDPENLTPVGVMGFEDLRWRSRQQTVENKKHIALIDRLAEEIADLDRENQSARAKILQARHNIVQLEHRLLKVLVKQEVTRNVGVALRPEEEVLRSQLETIQSQLSSPQIKGRLNELLSSIRMHKQEVSQQDFDSYTMTPSVQEQLKQFLEMQQSGIKALLDILHTDIDDMKIMKEDMVKVFGNPQPA